MPGPGNRMRNSRPFGRNMDYNNQGSGGQSFGGSKPSLLSTGPLVTNHLQLHELDLELALLKRKREMIETQQNLLVSETRFGGSNQFGFNQAPQSYGQRSQPTNNFSNFYNDGPGQQFTSQGGVKRRAIDPWDNSSPPKRFNAPSGPKRNQTRYEPRSSQPSSLMNSSFRQRRSAPSAPRTNFKPTKVTKPKPNAAPNKLNSLPVAERKNLVTKASGLVQNQKPNDNIYIYEADKPVNPKLMGRLELALGTVLREMRQEYGDTEPHVETFINISGQRALKQVIRERIRTIMLGKTVGPGLEVVALYRKEHPKDTDVELLNKARESIEKRGNLAIDIIKQGNPERYFRNNFKRLLDASLNTMFERMEKLYTDVENSGKPIQEIIDSMLKEAEKTLEESKEEEANAKNIDNGEIQSADNSATEADLETKENGAAAEANAAEDSTVETEPEGVAAKPEVDAAVAEENDTKPEENDTKPEENDTKPEKNDTKPEENDTKPEEVAAKSEKEETTEQSGDAPKENAETKQAASRPPRYQSKASSEELVRARFYSRLMETLMKRNLPVVLPRYKEFILRILGTESAFKETKAYLVKTTNEKVEEIANNPDAAAATPTKQAPSEKKSLFVRVMGRPALPKKKLMKAFLDDFHPTLIKKHRNMHNVLFISFDRKENFDNILAQNNTVIANCKLDIKVSEKPNKNKRIEIEIPDEGQEVQPANGDVEMTEKKDDSVTLNDTLDDQINDLLTSIREEEEKNDDEPENEGKDEPITENTEEAANKEETQEAQNNEQAPEPEEKVEESKDDNKETDKKEEVVQKDVEAVKTEAPAKGTPTRSSTRLTSTPTAVRTRRTSKLPN